MKQLIIYSSYTPLKMELSTGKIQLAGGTYDIGENGISEDKANEIVKLYGNQAKIVEKVKTETVKESEIEKVEETDNVPTGKEVIDETEVVKNKPKKKAKTKTK